MSCYTYFIRALRYMLAFVVVCSIAFAIDKELCGGVLDSFLSRVNPRLAIEYVDANLRLEAIIDYVKTDSSSILMRFLWRI
ncbi:hypothetical protein G5B00_08205 [Parapedobacter sp. SGR-10]|uniref:hypothetical protein n=1 Tax=Parapedobacter sp. SGR-10 TaxID=2710879 RepID=UPI0013D7C11C|nr:hypothetical protein [Parapedobacter sp. SGR-10]NGF56498.1 hypothetical protein [Parapedobacter sp. SGR-10]